MSLEATLSQTNELLTQLITILRTGIEAPAEIGAQPEKATRTRKAKAEPTEAASPAPAPTTTASPDHPDVVIDEGKPLGRVKTDPVGTRYFLIEKHNSVYAQKPGDADCTIQGAEIVPAWVYLTKKAEFAKLGNVGQAAAPTTAPAASPAPSTPAASSASSVSPTSSPNDEVPFQLITDRGMALGKSEVPGQGREALLKILRKWLPNDEKPTLSKLAPLGKNAEILADIEAAMRPAAEDFDPLA